MVAPAVYVANCETPMACCQIQDVHVECQPSLIEGNFPHVIGCWPRLFLSESRPYAIAITSHRGVDTRLDRQAFVRTDDDDPRTLVTLEDYLP